MHALSGMTRKRLLFAAVAVAAAACGIDAVGTAEPPPAETPDASSVEASVPPGSDAAAEGGDAAVEAFPCDAAICAVEIAAGYTHTCAAVRGDRPRCWGANAGGQLGSGLMPDGGADLRPSNVPRVVATGLAMTGVSAGGFINADHPFSCAHTAGGAVSCWGSDDFGQRGRGDAGADAAPPAVPAAAVATSVTDVQSGGAHSCAHHVGGGVSCWGYSDQGQLGRTVTSYDAKPEPVALRAPSKQVTAGAFHTCALLADESIDCWGFNNVGQLGRATSSSSTPTPGPVAGVVGAVDLSAGYAHSCAVLSGGTVLCFGWDPFGQLGRGTVVGTSATAAPVVLPPAARASKVCAGYGHSCALLQNGTAMCWGQNDKGQLGSGTVAGASITPSTSATPLLVDGLTGAHALACGGHHTCALVANGQAVCWGANDMGQLGSGIAADDNPHPKPSRVAF
jgi:alpha-tubulin suppressor-like RCC1 family protein